MMYIYWNLDIDELDQELFDKIINDGLAVRIDEEKLLSKTETISIDGKIIEYSWTLDELIDMRDGGGYLQLSEDIQVGLDEAIEILLEKLYQLCQDHGTSYAERIYNASNPSEEITRLLEESLIARIQYKVDEIQNNFNKICKQIADGTFIVYDM